MKKPIDGQFTSTHALAKFLLEGPDVPLVLDYADNMGVQANWTESNNERYQRLLEAEPDHNPAEPEEKYGIEYIGSDGKWYLSEPVYDTMEEANKALLWRITRDPFPTLRKVVKIK